MPGTLPPLSPIPQSAVQPPVSPCPLHSSDSEHEKTRQKNEGSAAFFSIAINGDKQIVTKRRAQVSNLQVYVSLPRSGSGFLSQDPESMVELEEMRSTVTHEDRISRMPSESHSLGAEKV